MDAGNEFIKEFVSKMPISFENGSLLDTLILGLAVKESLKTRNESLLTGASGIKPKDQESIQEINVKELDLISDLKEEKRMEINKIKKSVDSFKRVSTSF